MREGWGAIALQKALGELPVRNPQALAALGARTQTL